MTMMAILAGLCLLVGTSALYLASPNQRLRQEPLRWARWPGWALLALGQALLWAIMGVATAIFTGLTATMLLWSVIPLAIAWQRGERAKK